MPLDASRATSE